MAAILDKPVVLSCENVPNNGARENGTLNGGEMCKSLRTIIKGRA